jgi:diguanylate cyclase (GGDEF)-like protein
MNEVKQMQHKRVMALSAALVVFALFALWQLGNSMVENGSFIGLAAAHQPIYQFAACTLMLCAVVTIATKSIQDNGTAIHFERHDPLTGLANKARFISLIDRKFKKDPSAGGLIMMVDINRLKSINESMGRLAGDLAITNIGKRLTYLFERPCIVSRINTDVFAIYIPNVHDEAKAYALAAQLKYSTKLPLEIKGKQVFTSLYLGAFLFSGTSANAEQGLYCAELALIQAKKNQMDELVVFNEKMAVTAKSRSLLETDFREVIEQAKLEPHFQPLVAEDGVTLLGFEALARWLHPKNGYISPASFIPIAEELGYSGKLGVQIMRKACQYIEPLGDLIVAVNVSPKHFLHPDFVSEVVGILKETGIDAKRLEIEITESVFVSKTAEAIATIKQLRSLGVSIALDDFGTGYSGLSYLNKFAVNRIKIDAEFVREIETSSSARSLISTIVNMAIERNYRITVEGVETIGQLNFLRQFPGLWYQGYLFGKAVPVGELFDHPLLTNHDQAKFERERAANEQADEKSNVVELRA